MMPAHMNNSHSKPSQTVQNSSIGPQDTPPISLPISSTYDVIRKENFPLPSEVVEEGGIYHVLEQEPQAKEEGEEEGEYHILADLEIHVYDVPGQKTAATTSSS